MPGANPLLTLRHVQITFEPQAYQELIRKYSRGSLFPRSDIPAAAYWDRLPTYLISRCPFCGDRYTGALDTHSLHAGWMTQADQWESVGTPKRQQRDCAHFVAVQSFVNLNGLRPTEQAYFSNQLDVPFVMPPFVPDDPRSVAVLHSLPICRIEQDRFVPRYSLYMMTYYSLNPAAIWAPRRKLIANFSHDDPEARLPMLFNSDEASAHPHAWDRQVWVERGKLQWLDPDSAELALRAGPAAAFPYRRIDGYRHECTFRHGRRWWF